MRTIPPWQPVSGNQAVVGHVPSGTFHYATLTYSPRLPRHVNSSEFYASIRTKNIEKKKKIHRCGLFQKSRKEKEEGYESWRKH